MAYPMNANPKDAPHRGGPDGPFRGAHPGGAQPLALIQSFENLLFRQLRAKMRAGGKFLQQLFLGLSLEGCKHRFGSEQVGNVHQASQ